MSKTVEIIYSRQRSDFIRGRVYSNPRFFTTPRAGVGKVFLVGDWPEIRAAYEALGVTVEQLDPSSAVAGPDEARPQAEAPASLTPAPPRNDRGKVYLPEDWRDLPWAPKPDQDLSLRSLAAMVSDTPVLNKPQAIAAITAELARRDAEAPRDRPAELDTSTAPAAEPVAEA